MRTILVDQSGIQILPPTRDPHQMIPSGRAYQMLGADQRTKHATDWEYAARLYVKRVEDK